MSLVRRGLLISRALRRCGALVTLRVVNGEIVEGGLDEAEICLELVRHELLLRRDLGHEHLMKGSFYQAELSGCDRIMGFHFLGFAHARFLPHRCTLLVEVADKLSWLSTSMKPQASPWEPAERDVLAQSVRSVLTRPPTADIEDEYGPLWGCLSLGTWGARVEHPSGGLIWQYCGRVPGSGPWMTMDGSVVAAAIFGGCCTSMLQMAHGSAL